MKGGGKFSRVIASILGRINKVSGERTTKLQHSNAASYMGYVPQVFNIIDLTCFSSR